MYKIQIDKEILKDLYINQKLSPFKISKILNCCTITVRKYLKEYKLLIPRRGYSVEINFSDVEKEIINGALLGDGHITKNIGKSSQFSYASKVKNHVSYVLNFLQQIAVNENKERKLNFTEVFDARTQKTYSRYSFRTVSSVSFFKLRKKWYPNEIKIIPKDLILTPLICLIWYLGDGGNAKGNALRLSTDCFKKEDIEEILLPQLKQFEPRLHRSEKNKEQYRIYIPRRNIKSFLNYIGDCPFEEYKHKWNFIEYKTNNESRRNQKSHKELYPTILEEYIKTPQSIKAISKKYNISRISVKNFLAKNKIEIVRTKLEKQIEQYDLNLNLIKVWESGQAIKRELNFNASGVSECCRGKRKKYKNFIWKFKE